MLAEWDAELDKRSRAFAAHAAALADWDRAILSNRHGLLALEEQLCKARACSRLMLGTCADLLLPCKVLHVSIVLMKSVVTEQSGVVAGRMQVTCAVLAAASIMTGNV